MFETNEIEDEKHNVRIKRDRKRNPVAQSLSDARFLPKKIPIKDIYSRNKFKKELRSIDFY